jgi:tetratricopeptide (TPR) repeat protein
VEIEPRVFDTASWFKDINYEVWKDPRFNLHFKDARNDLLSSPALYDLIVSEPSNLWVPGVSSLFTTEFYQLAESRLTEDGVFAQWFPFFSIDLRDIRTQIRTLCRVFPHTQMWLIPDLRKRFAALTGGLLLMGSRRDLTMDYAAAEALFRDKRITEDFAKIGVDGPWPLLSMQWLDQKQMTDFAGEGPVNTDAFPRLEYSGPRSHYRTRFQENQSILEIFSAISRYRLNLFPELVHSPLEDTRVPKKKRTDEMTLLAVNYARLGRFTDSLGVIQRIRTLGFDSYEITYLRGKDLVFSGQDIAGGIEELRAALKMRPDEKNLLTNLGLLLIKTGKSGEAFELFRKASKKWPGEQGFIFGQGLSKFYGGDPDASRIYLREVLRINPNHPWAGVLIACIQSRAANSPQSDNFLNMALQP